ncbi:hypothetical protein CP557_02135 [Natrinema ejinorense]|uniref:Uncharacterized protein n=1 Tax=Natrinema ejinorense TaxID=373386 RepID=A0A2A5QRL7_9EURY|nr:hypothetical protein CP557_02135 [Natrinema ejinorense]
MFIDFSLDLPIFSSNLDICIRMLFLELFSGQTHLCLWVDIDIDILSIVTELHIDVVRLEVLVLRSDLLSDAIATSLFG